MEAITRTHRLLLGAASITLCGAAPADPSHGALAVKDQEAMMTP